MFSIFLKNLPELKKVTSAKVFCRNWHLLRFRNEIWVAKFCSVTTDQWNITSTLISVCERSNEKIDQLTSYYCGNICKVSRICRHQCNHYNFTIQHDCKSVVISRISTSICFSWLVQWKNTTCWHVISIKQRIDIQFIPFCLTKKVNSQAHIFVLVHNRCNFEISGSTSHRFLSKIELSLENKVCFKTALSWSKITQLLCLFLIGNTFLT